MPRKLILAIPGSTKSSSTSLSILKFLKEKHQHEIDLEIYDHLDQLPHFNPDLEKELPSQVLDVRQQIERADGLLFCTPEYVFSLPGSLKNLLEWNVSTILFTSKPVAMIVAAASGEKAFASLDLILTTIESTLPETSKLLIRGAKGKIEKNGKITEAALIAKLEKLIQSLIRSIDDTNRNPSKYETNS